MRIFAEVTVETDRPIRKREFTVPFAFLDDLEAKPIPGERVTLLDIRHADGDVMQSEDHVPPAKE